jgi:hypothetical protein
LSGKIYIVGEASIEALKTQITSSNPDDAEKAIDNSLLKITMLRTIVDEKQVSKIFIEDGSVLVRPIILNFPDANVEVLHVDPQVQRFIRVTRQQMADSIALKERLMSEFTAVREGSPKSDESTEHSAEQERFARVLGERMKGLPTAEELSHKLDEATAGLEAEWVEQIHYGFIDPSLVVCGRIHVNPRKEDIIASGKSGRMPELLKERGYEVELLFIEPE